MNSIFAPETITAIKTRINKLTPDSQRQWGTMDVAQMMAHCSVAIGSALSDEPGKMVLMGRIFGKLAKNSIVSPKPFKQSLPTAKNFVISDSRNFEKEKAQLLTALDQLVAKGATGVEGKVHPFFGKMDAGEWSNLMNKHLDHHLKQFGA